MKPNPEERVRLCLACEALVPFEREECPSCGTAFGGSEPDRIKMCLHCESVLDFRQSYCDRCGRLAGRLEEPEIAPSGELQPGHRFRDRLPEAIGLTAVAVGATTLGLAVFALLT